MSKLLFIPVVLLCLEPEAASQASTDATTGSRPSAPAASTLLGLSIQRSAKGKFQLINAATRKLLHTGSLGSCERERLVRLTQRFGRGKVNLPLPTAGGLQLWADEFVRSGWRIQQNLLTGHHRLLDDRDVRRSWGSFEACRVVFEEERLKRGLRLASQHLVVLVHGLGRTRKSFSLMQKALEGSGYEVIAVGYPSTRRSIEAHAAQLGRVLSRFEGATTVSFVTHSLGGIVVRRLLAGATGQAWRKSMKVHRLVMLGPPNQGSVVAKALLDSGAFKLLTGEVGKGLRPEAVAKIPAPSCPFGIIAGGTGTKQGLNPLIPGDNDGLVTVANTRLDGASDFLLVRAYHTFLMNDAAVIQATKRFLETGKFGGR